MSAVVIVLSVLLLLCIVLLVNLNGSCAAHEDLIIAAANELHDNGRVSDMTGAQILSAARRISE